ncbi:MAG: hypothetical protein IJ245_09220, partial [Lachnospiraceae bacterium]|nr:hypothetical protein [Lachnospiraceae bacterium]
MNNDENINNRISELAKKVFDLARDSIIVKYRFFDKTLAALKIEEDNSIGTYISDMGRLVYNPARLLNDYKEDPDFAVRLLLHVIFHNIFLHYSRKDIANREYWDLACDIAVENTILAMDSGYERPGDTQVQIILSKLNKWVPKLTAEYLYREFMVGGISSDSAGEYKRLFSPDVHYTRPNNKKEEIIISQEDWERIARRVSAELKSFSKDVKGKDTIIINLNEGVRKTYDYDDVIKRFAVMSEEIKVSPDEFDYVYYTYGLANYKNMPLIEPLEYTDENRIRDFVIAVDTSASVKGKLVKGFLEKTYDILTRSSSFSETMNVRIIQCDSEVTSDVTVKDKREIEEIAGKL